MNKIAVLLIQTFPKPTSWDCRHAHSFGFIPLLSIKPQSKDHFHEGAEYLVQDGACGKVESSLSCPQPGSRPSTFEQEWLCGQGAGMNLFTKMLLFSCHLLKNL